MSERTNPTAHICVLIAATISLSACNNVPSQGPANYAPLVSDAEYDHSGVSAKRFGESASEYWLFSPVEPTPTAAPFVVFMHGWAGMNPRAYGGWIEHIVRMGNIVVYPRFQENLRTPPDEMTDFARAAILDAWQRASDETGSTPERKAVAWVGHSLGAVLAAKLAATATADGLPAPAFLFLVEPGGHTRISMTELQGLPAETTVSLVTGEDDETVATGGADAIAAALAHLSVGRLRRTTLSSDPESTPPLLADHFAPLSASDLVAQAMQDAGDTGSGSGVGLVRQFVRGRFQGRMERRLTPDALDLSGLWRPVDALIAESFGN